jgi:tripartite-type tricarboxylate transporter receptor subunit TctC
VAEAGVPGYDYSSWIALFAPKGTPQPIVTKLRAEVSRSLGLPGMKERLEKSGLELWAVGPEELAGVMREDNARWMRVIREADIKVE